MKLYTKTGDSGSTSLVGGTRVSKADSRLEAYGTVDELMAFIGHLLDKIADTTKLQGNSFDKEGLIKELTQILDRLMAVASLLAAEDLTIEKLPHISQDDTRTLEIETDKLLEGLPLLKYFTLPAGNEMVSYAHICRTVCRRAERRIISNLEAGNAVPHEVTRYVNRLSDYLYALTRRLAHELKARELTWDPRGRK